MGCPIWDIPAWLITHPVVLFVWEIQLGLGHLVLPGLLQDITYSIINGNILFACSNNTSAFFVTVGIGIIWPFFLDLADPTTDHGGYKLFAYALAILLHIYNSLINMRYLCIFPHMQWTIENTWAFHIWPDGTPFGNYTIQMSNNCLPGLAAHCTKDFFLHLMLTITYVHVCIYNNWNKYRKCLKMGLKIQNGWVGWQAGRGKRIG